MCSLVRIVLMNVMWLGVDWHWSDVCWKFS